MATERPLDQPWWTPFAELEGVRVVHVDLSTDPNREAIASGWLDSCEAARMRTYMADRARRQFVLCRASLRINLCEEIGCNNRSLRFGLGEHGKPYAVVDGKAADVAFNVSHSGHHGLIALAAKGRLGVDVEVRSGRRDLDRIGKKVFGPSECERISRLQCGEKNHMFFRLWTMKESLSKALGAGLSLGFSTFEVPGTILDGAQGGEFRFPHLPDRLWKVVDLGENRFAAALAYESVARAQ